MAGVLNLKRGWFKTTRADLENTPPFMFAII